MKHHAIIAAVGVLSVAGDVTGQFPGALSIEFPAGGVYTGGAYVKVELWLSFDPNPNIYAWSRWRGDIQSDDPSGDWENLTSPYLMTSPSIGTPNSGGVVGIDLFQLHFPLGGYFANTANPIMIWTGEWSTSDLTPRSVTLTTSSISAGVYTGGITGGLILDEAIAEIQVIPSPVSLVPLVLATFATRQRRRPKLA